MTHTTTLGFQESAGSTFVRVAQIAISSYTSGGEVLTLAELGVNSTLVDIRASGRSGNIAAWSGSTTAPKLVVYSSGTTEASGNVGTFDVVIRYR